MKISYCFVFKDGPKKVFTVNLNDQSLNVTPPRDQAKPEWTRLSNFRCEECRLAGGTQYCPIAVNISEIVEFFKSFISYQPVDVSVATKERVYGKKTTVQEGLGSLLGIYMAASGCPSMERLKPMVRFHLPFASMEDTVFRCASTYLLAQYFLRKQGRQSDPDLVGLAEFYMEIQKVNQGMSQRLRRVVGKDAVNNAVICLDMFAQELPFAIEERLKELEQTFAVYWQ